MYKHLLQKVLAMKWYSVIMNRDKKTSFFKLPKGEESKSIFQGKKPVYAMVSLTVFDFILNYFSIPWFKRNFQENVSKG